jgi:hypothetical protein
MLLNLPMLLILLLFHLLAVLRLPLRFFLLNPL